MSGEEASLFVLTDGQDYALLAPAQDHKRIGEGDTGPNTGRNGRICAGACHDGRPDTRSLQADS